MNTEPGTKLRGVLVAHRALHLLMAVCVALVLVAATAHGGINGGGRARGVITAFGSIFVNGVEYELASAVITANGKPVAEDRLRVGQVVTVDGVVNANLVTGQATEVEYEGDVRGAVTAVNRTTSSFTVTGQTVLVNGATVFDGAFVPANLAGVKAGRVVEVSGFRNASGQLVATRVEVSGELEDRVVGKIALLDTAALTFMVGALKVDYSAAALIQGTLANGTLVEVQGPRVAAGVLRAQKVAVENEGLEGEAGEGASLEGIVTAALANGRFSVNGQVVQLSSTTRFVDGTRADLVADARVEAEGRFDAAGRIAATKVTIKHTDDAFVHATVDSVNLTTRTVTASGLTIKVDTRARLEDKSDLRLRPFALKDLHTGDTVEVKGYETRLARNVTAKELLRENDDGRTIVGGRVSSLRYREFDVLDLTVVVTTATRYRNAGDQAITVSRFFSTAANRDVKVRGTWNGTRFVAEEVEFQD